MTSYILRVLVYLICFIVSTYCLNALDYNRFLVKKVNPLKAQILYILLSACMAYLLGQFLMGIMWNGFLQPGVSDFR